MNKKEKEEPTSEKETNSIVSVKANNYAFKFDKSLLKIRPKYQEMFDFWIDFILDPAMNKIGITDRGTGKTKNMFLILLTVILIDKDFFASFLMRNFDDNTEQTRPLLIQILDEFCFEIWQGEKDLTARDKWTITLNSGDNAKQNKVQEKQRELWDAYYRGIEYEGIPRAFFLNLERPSKSRGTVNKPNKLVILDECMPSKEDKKQKRDKGRMWIPNEDSNFTMIYDSIRRGEQAIKMFLGNPNRPWIEGWYFLPHWESLLEEWTDWYWKNRPTNNKAWKEWTWTKEARMGDKRLLLKKTVHEEQEYASPEDNNWDNFFTKREHLKIMKKFLNGSQPLYLFNDCICYYANSVTEREGMPADGFWFFVHKDWGDIANRNDPKFWDALQERCYTMEQELNSQQKNKQILYLKDNKLSEYNVKMFRLELLGKHKRNQLWFVNDNKSREVIMEFISTGKYI